MGVRTISRDKANPRVVLVWPKGVSVEDVGTNDNNANYAFDEMGEIVQPVTISADAFKAAFGFVPLSGSVATYIMRKAHAELSVEQQLTDAISAVVKQVLNQDLDDDLYSS